MKRAGSHVYPRERLILQLLAQRDPQGDVCAVAPFQHSMALSLDLQPRPGDTCFLHMAFQLLPPTAAQLEEGGKGSVGQSLQKPLRETCHSLKVI